MAIEALKCKECGTTYPLEARFVCDDCFGPLEVAYDYSGLDAESTRRRIQAGPQSIWRYSDFLPFDSQPRSASRSARTSGVTPAASAVRGWDSNGRKSE